ncbi:hypothetical protein [Dictyobacter formicarum]|uniref:PsbP C-terminal domain-containing protein n=1 Tax=Dictyobacter formicarum TaxID=2778368 RepID=A0ABQ3VIN2_9CHLR|nr:hypothetical protein [Dictyobacter formicarum]GHO85233.1 hypothetical protein KSZ_32390 [Dictyobacter formicarum]
MEQKASSEKEDKTRIERMIEKIKKNPVIVVLTCLVALIIGFDNLTGSLGNIPGNISKLWLHPTPTSVDVALISDSYPRFGFNFQHPANWLRYDPTNSDGARYVDPNNTKVTVSGSGGYAVAYPSMEDEISAELKDARSHPHYHLLQDETPSDIQMTTFMQNGDKEVQEIPGERFEYEYQINGKQMSFMEQVAQAEDGNIIFTIFCQAPSDVYKAYRNLFLKIASSLEVYNQDVAPTATPLK